MQVAMIIQLKGQIHGFHNIELNVVKQIYCYVKRALLPPWPSSRRAGGALAPLSGSLRCRPNYLSGVP